MRHLLRHFRTLACVVSLLLCVGVCVLWVRSRATADVFTGHYARWQSDGGAADDYVEARSGLGGWMTFAVGHGRVGLPNGQLVWGYYVNADQSGGRPQFHYTHGRHDPFEVLVYQSGGGRNVVGDMSGWGPLRWQVYRRSDASTGERFRSVTVMPSHWLLAMLLAIPPVIAARRWVGRRRRGRPGHCAACGYDVRVQLAETAVAMARCPECGAAVKAIAA